MTQNENRNGSGRKLDDPVTVKWILRVFYVVCALLFGMDFVIHRHVSHDMENIPGFYAIYGFVGCVVLVVVARWMRVVLMRKEDYYQDSAENSDADNDGSDSGQVKEVHRVDR
ncbi:MAG: hypothetical protein ACJAYE_000036 [Candidatus Azotimanducaceae bacterium]|jgi:hypothetical protein